METDRVVPKVTISLEEYEALCKLQKEVHNEMVFVYSQIDDGGNVNPAYAHYTEVYYSTKDEAVRKLMDKLKIAEHNAHSLMAENNEYVKMLEEKCVRDIKKHSLWNLIWIKLFVREPKRK